MPTLPTNSKCATLGCKNPRSRLSTMCIQHGGKDKQTYYTNDARIDANAMYATPQWQRQRMRILSSQPICQSCLEQGRIIQATEVDHVFPWRQLGKQAFYRNLFQSLCHNCHSSKTQLERKGTIRYFHSGTHVDFSINDYATKVP